jgi:hypothetical protein
MFLRSTTKLSAKISILDLLAACSLNLGGSLVVIQGFKDYKDQKLKKEDKLFSKFVDTLSADWVTIDFLVAALAFVNCVANGPPDLEMRISNRRYFEEAGLLEFLNQARGKWVSGELDIQLDIWSREREADQKELAEKKKEVQKLTNQAPVELFNHLEKELAGTRYYSNFLYVLRQIFSLQTKETVGREVWAILEKVMRDIHDMVCSLLPSFPSLLRFPPSLLLLLPSSPPSSPLPLQRESVTADSIYTMLSQGDGTGVAAQPQLFKGTKSQVAANIAQVGAIGALSAVGGIGAIGVAASVVKSITDKEVATISDIGRNQASPWRSGMNVNSSSVPLLLKKTPNFFKKFKCLRSFFIKIFIFS